MALQVSQVVEKKHPKPVVKPGEVHKFTGQVILTALSLSSTLQPLRMILVIQFILRGLPLHQILRS